MRYKPATGAVAMVLAVWFSLDAEGADPRASSQQVSRPGIVKAEFIFDEAPFASCHASTIADAGEGLAAAWFAGSREGQSDVGIWMSREEGGRWSQPVEIANGISPDEKHYPCWNPVLFQVKSGPLMLFYKVGPNPETWWGMLIRSTDGGRTWSDPERLPNGILGPIKNKPVMLADGRILCGSSVEHGTWRTLLEWTSDGGHTWEKTQMLGDGVKIASIQPTILSHGDGKLQILCRTRQGYISESWSDDGGRSWSDMVLTELPNPNSGIDAITLRDGRHLLIYNPTTLSPNIQDGPRSPLDAIISQDGKSWKTAQRLEDPSQEPFEYSYPAVIQTDDELVHVTYTWRRLRIKHVVLDPSKLQSQQTSTAYSRCKNCR